MIPAAHLATIAARLPRIALPVAQLPPAAGGAAGVTAAGGSAALQAGQPRAHAPVTAPVLAPAPAVNLAALLAPLAAEPGRESAVEPAPRRGAAPEAATDTPRPLPGQPAPPFRPDTASLMAFVIAPALRHDPAAGAQEPPAEAVPPTAYAPSEPESGFYLAVLLLALTLALIAGALL